MSQSVRIERRGDNGVAELIFDVPGRRSNVLSTGLIEALDHTLDVLADERGIRVLVVRSGKQGVFLAGPDLVEVAALDDASIAVGMATRGCGVLRRLEQLPYPVVAAIDGPALGSGLEVALACRYRVASSHPATRLGLQQVSLGMIPALGGTQRLPRQIGVRRALPMLLHSTLVTADEALSLGIVDQLGPPGDDFVPWAIDWAVAVSRTAVARPSSWSPIDVGLKFGPLRDLYLLYIERSVRRSTRSLYPAPLSALSSVREGLRRRLDDGLEVEAGLAGTLVVSDECKGLIRTHLAAGRLERSPGVDLDTARSIARVGLLGDGESGGALAGLLATAGIDVRLRGTSLESLRRAMQVARTVGEGQSGQERVSEVMRRIAPALVDRGLSHNDLVIHLMSDDSARGPTNLGTYATDAAVTVAVADVGWPLARWSRQVSRPERLVAIRFAGAIRDATLVEVVRVEATEESTVAMVVVLLRRCGRIPLVVGDGAGYLVGRLRTAALVAAMAMLRASVSVESVDQALVDFGMRDGLFSEVDSLGVDRMERELALLREVSPERFVASPLLSAMVEKGLHGRRVSHGFYLYSGGHRRPGREVARIVKSLAGDAPSTVAPPRGAVQERVILAMVNEAAHAIADGVASSIDACDLAAVVGLGFPAFRGGVFGFASTLGSDQVMTALDRLQQQYGESFRPAPRLPALLDVARARRRDRSWVRGLCGSSEAAE